MFRYEYGFGFNTGRKRIFGAVFTVVTSVVAALNNITRNVASTPTVEVTCTASVTVVKSLSAECSVEVNATAQLYNNRLIWGQPSGVFWGTEAGINWGE